MEGIASSASTLLQTTNGLAIALVAIAVLVVLIKKGWLKISSDHLKVGVSGETERKILKDQYEWMLHYMRSREVLIQDKIGSMEGYDAMRTKLVLETLIDEVAKWILLNHITKSPTYVETKKDIVYSIVAEGSAFPTETASEDMSAVYAAWTEEVINKLLEIREYYEK